MPPRTSAKAKAKGNTAAPGIKGGADEARSSLRPRSVSFTHTERVLFPDAGITTPKHITYKLVKYAKRHPETELTVLAIPQIPGYRRESRSNHGIAESLVTTTYVVPIIVLNPYVAGGLLADYLVRGRYKLIPKDPPEIGPDNMQALTRVPIVVTPPAPVDELATQRVHPALTSPGSGQENSISSPTFAGTAVTVKYALPDSGQPNQSQYNAGSKIGTHESD